MRRALAGAETLFGWYLKSGYDHGGPRERIAEMGAERLPPVNMVPIGLCLTGAEDLGLVCLTLLFSASIPAVETGIVAVERKGLAAGNALCPFAADDAEAGIIYHRAARALHNGTCVSKEPCMHLSAVLSAPCEPCPDRVLPAGGLRRS